MQCMLVAKFTILLELQPVLERTLVLARKIVNLLALRAFHFDHVVLRHKN